MSDFMLIFGVIAVVLAVTALASGLVERSPLSFPILFLGLGFALGHSGFGVIVMGPHSPLWRLPQPRARLFLWYAIGLDIIRGVVKRTLP